MAQANSGRRWSADDLAQLLKLKRQNTPTRLMALKLKRTESGIRGKAQSLNLSLKPTNQSPYGTKKK